MTQPKMIHRDTRSERIVRVGDPLRESEPSAATARGICVHRTRLVTRERVRGRRLLGFGQRLFRVGGFLASCLEIFRGLFRAASRALMVSEVFAVSS
jgi:hypothetical protein